MKRYRLTFETVSTQHLALYSNADPRWYSNTTQTVPNSEIPEEHWHVVSREADTYSELENQFRQLKAWADGDEQFVRNPRIDELTGNPTWREVTR